MHIVEFKHSKISKLLFHGKKTTWLWLIVRIYLGWQWIQAGWEKVTNPAWVGQSSGSALTGFLNGALQKSSGDHPAVSDWYAWLISNIGLHNTQLISYVVTYGEILVGIALILGLFTGFAAFLGAFMNFNYLFAGAVSINPQMILLEFFVILAWRNAGYVGLDFYILPFLFKHKKQHEDS